ncbi:MAG: U32 family peptidase, partial [Paracoccaceae bacterium]|nr:U32 family peptidase [Paracoccaceae bacterium]
MDLTVGPNPFFWEAETVRAFYQSLTTAPVKRVVLGEVVCSKRLPFWQNEIAGATEALLAAGKDVALT